MCLNKVLSPIGNPVGLPALFVVIIKESIFSEPIIAKTYKL